MTETLTLRGGLRYTDDEKDFVAERFQVAAVRPRPASASSSPRPMPRTSAGTSAATGPLNETSNFYGRVATGFRAPSIQGRLLFGDIDLGRRVGERCCPYEAGVKADLWDKRARLSASRVFHYTVDDQQLTAVGGATNFNTLINAEETEGQGFELDFEAYLTDNLLVTLGASYNDTEINDPDLVDPGLRRRLHRARPGRRRGPAPCSIDGNPLPQAPKWVAQLHRALRHSGGRGEFFVYTDWAYRSEVNFFLYESAEFTRQAAARGRPARRLQLD